MALRTTLVHAIEDATEEGLEMRISILRPTRVFCFCTLIRQDPLNQRRWSFCRRRVFLSETRIL